MASKKQLYVHWRAFNIFLQHVVTKSVHVQMRFRMSQQQKIVV